jgi:hypothetical protein
MPWGAAFLALAADKPERRTLLRGRPLHAGMETSTPQAIPAGAASPQANPPDRVILVFDGDGGLGAMLVDVVKKAVGRDQLPSEWGISRATLPCILGRVRDERPFILLTRDEIEACAAEVDALEGRLRRALSLPGGDQ